MPLKLCHFFSQGNPSQYNIITIQWNGARKNGRRKRGAGIVCQYGHVKITKNAVPILMNIFTTETLVLAMTSSSGLFYYSLDLWIDPIILLNKVGGHGKLPKDDHATLLL